MSLKWVISILQKGNLNRSPSYYIEVTKMGHVHTMSPPYYTRGYLNISPSYCRRGYLNGSPAYYTRGYLPG